MALAALSLLGGRTTAQEPACKTPLMGWSSWNAYRVNISEDIIKHQADLMVEKGLKDAGYRFINIDDGFFGYRDETGKMHEHAQRFPNGMKVVVDHIHNLGLKAGIYTDAGNNTCGSMSDQDKAGIGAGIYGHEAQDAQLYFGDWGFDFIKIDYFIETTLPLRRDCSAPNDILWLSMETSRYDIPKVGKPLKSHHIACIRPLSPPP